MIMCRNGEHPTPIYPTTAGLHQATLRNVAARALALLDAGGEDFLPELLPAMLVRDRDLPTLKEALLFVHRPPLDAPVEALLAGSHPARRRLALEELIAHQLSLRRLRTKVQGQRAPVMRTSGALRRRFLETLPFTLTAPSSACSARSTAISRVRVPCSVCCRAMSVRARPRSRPPVC